MSVAPTEDRDEDAAREEGAEEAGMEMLVVVAEVLLEARLGDGMPGHKEDGQADQVADGARGGGPCDAEAEDLV